jgi:uncharacterized protein YkwD
MKTWRSFRTAAAGAALSFLFIFLTAHSQDQSQNRPPHSTPPLSSHPSSEERLLLDAANRERAAEGLQGLKWDNALAEAARQHAQVMVSQNLLLHQCLDEPPLDERAAKAGAKFSIIAENIAVGPNPETIHNGWMHSAGHRKNILNADVTAVGIATMRGSGGLFAVQDFSRPIEALSLKQQEEKVVSLLKVNGFPDADATDDARKTCNMDRSFAGAPASYVIRFEVTDLNKLPDDLLQKVKSRAYRRAAVGACHGADTAGFTRYRIAVLLN